MSLNQQAVSYLEKFEYDLAKKTFQQALAQKRNVQSLHNFAHYLAHEEDEFHEAIVLLEEAVSLKPTHHFPFAFLTQLYIQTEQYEKAVPLAKASLAINDTSETRYNLAVSLFHLGKFDDAAKTLFPISRKDESAKFLIIQCHFQAGRNQEAKRLLARYAKTQHRSHERLFEELSIAELYWELACYEEAIFWYEEAVKGYYHDPRWVAAYIHALTKTNQQVKAKDMLQLIIGQKVHALREAANDQDFDEHFTQEENEAYMDGLKKEKKAFENIPDKLANGWNPAPTFDPSLQVRCYLFGCTRHNYDEYTETN